MKTSVATTDSEIAACYPVMRELRPHAAREEFVPPPTRGLDPSFPLILVAANHAMLFVGA